jgi:hypothetical protein
MFRPRISAILGELRAFWTYTAYWQRLDYIPKLQTVDMNASDDLNLLPSRLQSQVQKALMQAC